MSEFMKLSFGIQKLLVPFALSFCLCCPPLILAAPKSSDSTNSLGMRMVSIAPGTFEMGAETFVFNLGEKTPESKDAPFWDETPRHQVTISKPFRISEEKVTAEQFRQFQPAYQ